MKKILTKNLTNQKGENNHGREGEELTVEIYDEEKIPLEGYENTLAQAEEVISKVLADLKSCSEAGKAVLEQILKNKV